MFIIPSPYRLCNTFRLNICIIVYIYQKKMNSRRYSEISQKRKPFVLLALGFGMGFVMSAATLLNIKVALNRWHTAFNEDTKIGFSRKLALDGDTQGTSEAGVIILDPKELQSTKGINSNEIISATGLESESPLKDVKILVAIAAFDFNQIPHLEDVLDSYHDIAIAGAKVDVVIHATVAYPVTFIDLLNSRFTTQNFSIKIILKPSTLRLHLVDCHRELFYEQIDGYDLFIYTEEDIRVTPRTVATYLEESRRIQELLVNDKKYSFSDFNVGVVRYEYNYPSNVLIDDRTRHAIQNVTRVYWEHSSFKGPIIPTALDAVPQEGVMSQKYVHMKNHHQGMFLATRDLLLAWKHRSNCNFDIIKNRPGSRSQPSEGTQRVWMSSQQLFGRRHCDVQQVLPMHKFGALTVHHVPNKNYRRVGKYRKRKFSDGTEEFDQSPDLLTAMQLHLTMRQMWPAEAQIPYRGTVTVIDEVTQKRTILLERRLKEYRDYVERGGVLSESDFAHTALLEDS